MGKIYTTIVKAIEVGNIDIGLVMAKWEIHCFISSLCWVQRGPVNIGM